ncbi:hypothetical protein FKW77_010747 [Venturia effusa]|uniref:FAD-binding domain-containing protein n=1 Tax=Venturia effusa TaxID=50376 RepID=A0A517KYD3_9PEZI|nr:hypothetical protein FKW77_010747 [Venturia effusa]
MTMTRKDSFRIGIIGAGLGGLMAGIAIAEAGGKVTILEAASKLGEIGAGIQMTPNAARLLRRYGIEQAIGDNLVRNRELHLRTKEGRKVGFVKIEGMEAASGGEWWLVHRHHLHEGLVTTARKFGCNIITDSRVTSLDYKDPKRPVVITTKSSQYTFDLVLGADGINGITRRTLFPDAIPPFPPRNNAAFRAIVPASRLRKDSETKGMLDDIGINVWMAQSAYAIIYPISGGRDINVVLSHTTTKPLLHVEAVELEEVKRQYSDFEAKVQKVIGMIDHPIQRWPLLVTQLERWSSHCRRIVLLGDSAHSMVNHMAQGAATAMEDAVFLSVLIKSLIDHDEEAITLSRAIELYEKERMPVVKMKQEASNRNGRIMHLSGILAVLRNLIMRIEWRYPNLLGAQNLMRGEKEGPQMCISQMGSQESMIFRRDLKEAVPAVEDGVAEILCSLPYASCNDECYKIAPCTMMPGPDVDRELYSFGPILPSYMVRLTDWWGGDSRMLVLLDVMTGITTELKDYKPGCDDEDPHGKVMTEWNGPQKNVEDLLRGWIDNYLSMRWIPDGSMDVMDSESRSMEFLKYKALFEEFGWPSAFPLPQPRFNQFLKRHSELREEQDYSNEQLYLHIWHKLSKAWHNPDRAKEAASGDDSSSDHQRVGMLDQKIQEAFHYEKERAEDLAYANATGGEISEYLKAPTRLHNSANIGEDWRIDIKAADIMERFWDVIAFKSEPQESGELEDLPPGASTKNMDDLLEEMGKVMEAAYHRYLDPEEAEREVRMVGVPDEDDDFTSDFEFDESDEDDSSDTMEDSDVDADEDLDVAALQTDMDLDVEEIREQMANSQVARCDSQASSLTLQNDASA